MLAFCCKDSCVFRSNNLLFPFLCALSFLLNLSLCVFSYMEWVCNSFRIHTCLCSGYYFRHAQILSTKVNAKFIFLVLCVNGLSLFILYHHTNNIFTVIEVLSFLCRIFPCKQFRDSKNICDSIAQCMLTLFQPQTQSDFIYLFIHLALLNNSVRDPSLERKKPTFFLKVVMLLPWDFPLQLGVTFEW